MPRLAGLLGLLALLSAAPFQGAWSADERDVIEYRRHIMNTLNEQSGALGQILSTAIPRDNAVAHLEAIALTASIALKAFEPKVPGGEARAEVWTNWPDFSQRMTQFAQKTAAAAKVARTNPDAAFTDILDVLTCKACHDVYRDEKHK